MRTIKLTEETRKDLLEKLLKRSPNCYGEYEGRVTEIVNTVRAEGDKALFAYTERFDRAKITAENIRVTEEEIQKAYEEVDPELLSVIRKALVNIRSYHEKQLKQSWFESQPSGIILRLCSRRKGGLSFFCSHEHRSGQGSRCGKDHHVYALFFRGRGLCVHTGGSQRGRRG